MDAVLALIADYWAAVVAAVVCGVAAYGLMILYGLAHGEVPEYRLMALEAGVISHFVVVPAASLGAAALVGPSGGVGRLLLVIGTVVIGLILHLVLISLNPAKSRVPALLVALGAVAAAIAVTWAVASWLPVSGVLVVGVVGFLVFAYARSERRAEARLTAFRASRQPLAEMPGWAIGPCEYNTGTGLWRVVAFHPAVRGRRAKREAIEATGATEIEALRALTALLEARAISRR